MPTQVNRQKPIAIFLAALPIALAAYFYLPILDFGFVWDDHIYMSIRPVNLYFEYWLENGREPFVLADNYFRPIAYASLWLDLSIGSGGARSFHATNLLLHIINISLVGWLTHRALRRARSESTSILLPASAMFFYGLHPALIEPVSWISCRFDLLTTTCVLMLLRVELSARSTWSWLAIALLFVTALLSKETAIGLLAAWPAWLFATRTRGETRKRIIHGSTALIFGLGLALLLRWTARGHLWLGADALIPAGESLRLLALTIGEATRLALLPFGSAGRLHFSSEASMAWVMLPLLISAFALIAWRRHPPARAALAMGATACLAFLPVSNLLPIPAAAGIFTADRYLTLPLALLAIALAMGIDCLEPRARRYALPILVVWITAATVTLRPVQSQWRDDVAFWTSAYNRNANVRLIENNLAAALEGAGRYDEAQKLLTAILAKRPNDGGSLHNLARVKIALLAHAEALPLLERATRVRPDDSNLQVDRAVALAGVGRTEEAISLLRDVVLARDPGMQGAHLVLLELFLATGQTEAARAHVASHPGVFRHHLPENLARLLEQPD
jgi:tetratricopeptide (TPR) repeat protein